jgi:hypothetical protein
MNERKVEMRISVKHLYDIPPLLYKMWSIGVRYMNRGMGYVLGLQDKEIWAVRILPMRLTYKLP